MSSSEKKPQGKTVSPRLSKETQDVPLDLQTWTFDPMPGKLDNLRQAVNDGIPGSKEALKAAEQMEEMVKHLQGR